MKRARYLFPVAVLLLLMAGGRAYAHHSFAANFYVDQIISVKGTVTEFIYRNPHSYVNLNAKDDKGQVTAWSVEWGGAAQLTRDHVHRDSLKPGDVVVVTGNPGRAPGEHRIRLHKIERPSDGWKWEGVIM